MPLKVGHHRLNRETPLKWCFAGVPIMAQSLNGSFVIFRGPSSAQQGDAIEIASRWHADNGPIIECWLCSFVIFRGSGSILLGNSIFL